MNVLISLHDWFVPAIPFLVFRQHSNPASVHFASIVVYSCPRHSTLSDFDVFPREKCASHLHFSPSCVPLKTRLNWLQTVIDGPGESTNLGQNVETPQISIGHELLRTTVGILAAGHRRNLVEGQHELEQSYTANQHGAWISCARCALRLHYVPRHTARMTSDSTPSSASVQEALKRMSLLRDNDFTAKAVRDMIAEVEGRKPRKKKATPQTTIVYNTVYNSGAASSATISSGTPVRREISTPPSPQSLPDNSSLAPLCCERPPEGKG